VPRAPRHLQWSEEACFHLMNRGHNRETVFADDDDRRAFVELVARYRDRVGFRLFHYCLMSNHFHLLVKRSITSWHRKRKTAKSAGGVSCWVGIRANRQFGVEIW